MHHRKGWMNRRKEPLFRIRIVFEGRKRCKTRWIPQSLVGRLLERMNQEFETEILEDTRSEQK